MSYCNSCGNPLEGGAQFCTRCGARLDTASSPNEGQVSVPVSAYDTPQMQPPPAYQNSYTPVALVKKHASSPLFLTGLILLTVTIFVSIISAMTAGNTVSSAIDEVEDALISDMLFSTAEQREMQDLLNNIREFFDGFMIAIIIYSLLAQLPSILICVGLWLLFESSFNKNSPAPKSTGISLVRGVSIFNFVMTLVLLGLITIGTVAFTMILTNEVGVGDIGGFISAIIIVTILIVTTFIIFYYIPMLKIMKNVRLILQGHQNPVKFGMLFPILVFISAGFSLISALTVFPFDPLGGFQVLLPALPGLFMSIAYLVFRSEYNRFFVRPPQQNNYNYTTNTYQ
jgi:hypothetical protein